MERTRLFEFLERTETRLADCSLRISYHEYLIACLKRDGRDTGFAETVLADLRKTEQTHWENRSRLLSKINANDNSAPRHAP